MKPIELSYYILQNFNNISEQEITPLKIQKLLYYVYVWGIVSDKKFFNEKFLKWDFGPVLPSVYYEFKSFGKNPIPFGSDKNISVKQSDKKFIDFVVSNYVKFNAVTLSSMTHQDEPWKLTSKNKEIDEKTIKQFYSKLNFAKNFPIDHEKTFYPVATDLHYSFVLDFLYNSPESTIFYSSYNKYLEIEQKAKTEFNYEFSKWLAL